ncbi:zinc finger and BTB domain-containing protein 8A isoform X3 [Lagopus leucura]|uniref:zinc finger and BTB domain-containing protein 8A isoform X3 n=1 Tax=Lagopus leucura TaxID=30410 RepID=UPI001C66ACFE|nr:zinc finger and BTB domain-containing protein 8A isoform X3 [Lagopus leucura]
MLTFVLCFRGTFWRSLIGMEISSHQFQLLEQLNEQRKQDLFCDCSILVEGKVFKAHRNVLFASSGYFKMLLSQSSKDNSQPTVATFEVFSPETFMVILDFVYSGVLPLTGQNVIEVMSAASYLQMTDILNVCKTFIKSSLDINEKEKDHYLGLSAKSTNGEPAHASLYRSRRKAKSNPRRSYSIPDEKADVVNENSWSSYSTYLSSQVILQRAETQLSKRGRKQGSARKRRKHLGLSQTREFVQGRASKAERAEGCNASDCSHDSRAKEEAEFDAENDVDRADDGYDQESEVTPKRCPASPAVQVPLLHAHSEAPRRPEAPPAVPHRRAAVSMRGVREEVHPAGAPAEPLPNDTSSRQTHLQEVQAPGERADGLRCAAGNAALQAVPQMCDRDQP